MAWYEEFVRQFKKCFIDDDRYLMLVKGLGVTIKVSLLALNRRFYRIFNCSMQSFKT